MWVESGASGQEQRVSGSTGSLPRPASAGADEGLEMGTQGAQAVVLGASMAGLLAARVLADHFQTVVVVERDVLPPAGSTRKGVQQARHAHLLLPPGAHVLDELFPGLLEGLVAEQVPVTVEPAQCHMSFGGHVFANHGEPWPDPTYQVSRALLEGRVLQRVRELPNVEIREGRDVVALEADDARGRVVGARVQRTDGETPEELLRADLTVAATGRGGGAGRWLAEMGYQPPVEERLDIDLMYVSWWLRLPPAVLGAVQTVAVGAVPERPTGMGLFQQEDDRWILTVSGYAGHHPPTEWPQLLAFLRQQLPASIVAAVEQSQQLSGPHTHRYPASVRRRYDKARRLPDRLIVLGDAMCSFNPLYGQGMTVAALEASALDRCLAAGSEGLARRFYRRSRGPIDAAWQLAVSADLALPSIPGPRPLPVRVANAYVQAVQAAAARDPAVMTSFLRVTTLLDPPSRLFAPATVARVVRARSRAVAARADSVSSPD